ncbi:MAG: bifunctional 5,10-methylenetetrahydrofolate dehydrogenase/5,10-methenyltetrahydrofolate cyclohydrolase [Bacteroidota bacterium]
MQILDGKKLSQVIKDEIKEEVEQIVPISPRKPHLVAIIVGDNPASHTYVKHKIRSCKYVGFHSTLVHLPIEVSEYELLSIVEKNNQNPEVDGIIVQMPLPEHISQQKIIQSVTPRKDVDGFHPFNVGMLTQNYFPTMIPATPSGILEMIKRYDIPTKGKHCVMVGRSRIVGRPTSILMSRGGYPGEATVTICHKHTPAEDLKKFCLQGDIIIVATGIPGLIKADMIKEGAVVIDVGITRVPADDTKSGYRLKGDVDFPNVAPKTSYITPVPGGVGPMTVAMLLKNTLDAFKNRETRKNRQQA